MNNNSPGFLTFFILGYILLSISYASSNGFYTLSSFIVLISSFAIFLFSALKLSKFEAEKKNEAGIIPMILSISIIIGLISYGGMYQIKNGFYYLSILLFPVALVCSFVYLFKKEYRTLRFKSLGHLPFAILILISVLLRIFMIMSSPNPKIDVFYLLKNSGQSWYLGHNPYQMNFPKLYKSDIPDHFDYFPMAFVSMTPAVVLFKDPRYTFVLAEMATAMVIYYLAKRKDKKTRFAQIMSLIFLYNPVSTFVIEQSWLDPLLVLGFSLFLYLYYLNKKILSIFILSLTFGVKQNFLPAVLFLTTLPRHNFKHILYTFILLGLIVAPFFFWSPNDFIRDTLLYPIFRPLRFDGLTLFSFLYSLFGISRYPLSLFLPVMIILAIYLLKFSKRNPFAWSFSIALFFFGFFILFKEAFMNYYYLVSSLFIISLSLKNEA
ncbi:MAG: hypothetical protein UT63_C0062G0002 [Candidatus Gottesmanbacteria bacterium GW2011_GWC2_39_8]|uniref:Glycosyltransferase RgtA/B/C/D-like domain-containing protein n=1 Tax=Candidatus Gottesmanbacteria bacterium GW2011_GWC2_39_8 TaxID=1618450 RepID=A0A0G0Q2Z0_9BACT|nr:MAG: hypothetical protein UT63_C0062G0002 [Candidatus Gottesmanbacteria bacterium GW2011_GWC2_39_8]